MTPKNSGELLPFKHQVLLNYKGKWLVQRSVLNCNKITCWKLLTEEPLDKIHALRILDKINGKTQAIISWDSSTSEWIQRPDLEVLFVK